MRVKITNSFVQCIIIKLLRHQISMMDYKMTQWWAIECKHLMQFCGRVSLLKVRSHIDAETRANTHEFLSAI